MLLKSYQKSSLNYKTLRCSDDIDLVNFFSRFLVFQIAFSTSNNRAVATDKPSHPMGWLGF